MPTQAFQIHSQSLAERRSISVFLPNNCKCVSACPVIFCADGQTVDAFSRRIEREVDEGTPPQIILGGVRLPCLPKITLGNGIPSACRSVASTTKSMSCVNTTRLRTPAISRMSTSLRSWKPSSNAVRTFSPAARQPSAPHRLHAG